MLSSNSRMVSFVWTLGNHSIAAEGADHGLECFAGNAAAVRRHQTRHLSHKPVSEVKEPGDVLFAKAAQSGVGVHEVVATVVRLPCVSPLNVLELPSGISSVSRLQETLLWLRGQRRHGHVVTNTIWCKKNVGEGGGEWKMRSSEKTASEWVVWDETKRYSEVD